MQAMALGGRWPAYSPAMTGGGGGISSLLRQYPALRHQLDEEALQMLHAVEPGRAQEIIEDLVAKGDVRNPSAFVASSLAKFPHRRRGPGGPGPADHLYMSMMAGGGRGMPAMPGGRAGG